MTIKTLSLAELRGLSADERKRRLAAFVETRSAPLNGEAEFLAHCLNELETRYEMSSTTMVERVRDGRQVETADICKWMILLDAKNSLEQQTG